MSFRPCLVVPVYDPGPALERTLASLLPYDLPLYVTDDGSGEETRRRLEALAREHPQLRLSRLPENRGKGAAVMEAFRRAHRDGLTHALQVDADGQHDAGAVEGFLALGRAHPDAIVAGRPAFVGRVPAARRYGRYFTHLWVWLETLSFEIGDSLCGFRLYPLAPTVGLMDRVAIPSRMDFDSEILVRLHWEGLRVLNAEVRVVYPEDGVSHFHLLRDNLRLARMHTRLVFGMLPRLPRLLARRLRPREGAHWSDFGERGTALGLNLCLWTYRLLGRRGLKALSELVGFYFFVFGARARQASRTYLTRVHAHFGPLPDLPGEPRLRDVYRHFRAFTSCMVERFLTWVEPGRDLDLDFPALEEFQAITSSDRGALFLSAHVGNLDALRAVGLGKGLRGLNTLVNAKNAVRFQNLLKKINPDAGLNLIPVASVGPEVAIDLQERLERGECLFVLGDRTPVSENGRTVSVPFLGQEAPFAQGPFILAHLLKCPVYLFYCTRDGSRHRVHLERLADRLDVPRQGRDTVLSEWAGRYARSLEERCRQTPFEWFNFFDFWCPDPSASRPHP